MNPVRSLAYSIVGCGESGHTLVERLLGRRSGSGPGRVVHVIRDGRDAAVAGWDALPPGHGFSFDVYAASFAAHWVSFVEHVRSAAEGHGGRYMELRYETLVTNTAYEVARLLQFLNMDASGESIQACLDRVRLDPSTVGIWRDRFDDEAAFRFDAVAGYLLRDLGYADETGRGLRRAA